MRVLGMDTIDSRRGTVTGPGLLKLMFIVAILSFVHVRNWTLAGAARDERRPPRSAPGARVPAAAATAAVESPHRFYP